MLFCRRICEWYPHRYEHSLHPCPRGSVRYFV